MESLGGDISFTGADITAQHRRLAALLSYEYHQRAADVEEEEEEEVVEEAVVETLGKEGDGLDTKRKADEVDPVLAGGSSGGSSKKQKMISGAAVGAAIAGAAAAIKELKERAELVALLENCRGQFLFLATM